MNFCVAQRRGNTRGHPYVSWDRNRTHPKIFISGDFSFLAFEWAPFGSFGSIWTSKSTQTRGRRGEGGGGEWGAARAENFGFCGQIRAVQPPGNSDTAGELGKLIRLRERADKKSKSKKECGCSYAELNGLIINNHCYVLQVAAARKK